MSLILRLLLVCGLLFAAQTANAACATSPGATAGFGSRTSYDIRGGSISAVATSATLTCNGSLVSLVSTDYANATPTSTNNFRLRSAAGDFIGYKLSPDSAGSRAFTQGGTINYLDSTNIGLLGALSGTSFAPTIYAKLTEAPNVPAGTYSDTVTVAWSWEICRGIGFGNACILQERSSGTSTLTVTVTVTADCRIIAPNVSFDSAPLASRFVPVTKVVAVDCTKGATFNVAFTAGTSGASRPWRQMRDGSGHVLRYNLYRPDGTTIWDEQNPLRLTNAGTGEVTPVLLHPYVAKVDADQSTPPAGNYSDTVSVVVTF